MKKKEEKIDQIDMEYPWIDNCLMVTAPLVVKLSLVKYHRRLVVFPGVNVSNTSLAGKKADVFKINDDGSKHNS